MALQRIQLRTLKCTTHKIKTRIRNRFAPTAAKYGVISGLYIDTPAKLGVASIGDDWTAAQGEEARKNRVPLEASPVALPQCAARTCAVAFALPMPGHFSLRHASASACTVGSDSSAMPGARARHALGTRWACAVHALDTRLLTRRAGMAAGMRAAGTRRTCFQRLHVDRLAVQVHNILAALLLDVHFPRPLAHAPVLDLAILRRVLVARHLLLAPIIRWRSLPRLLAEVDVPAMARAVGPHGNAYVVRAGIVVEAAKTVWERLRGGFEGKVGSMALTAHSVQKPSRVKPVMAIPFVEHVTSSSPYTFFLSVEPKTPARATCSIAGVSRCFPNSSEATHGGGGARNNWHFVS